MADSRARRRSRNRGAITACVILAVIMQALDTTIANVALPYIQGSVSASQDQINWVLTSYIVAAAIMTPPSGWLASRFGRKRVLLVSIAGFVVASMLCGMAQSLAEIVRLPPAAGLLRRGAGAALAGDPARHLHAGGARLGHGAVRRVGDGRPGAGPGDRRLADRQHQLALGVLHQPADRRAGLRRRHRSSSPRPARASRARLDWLGFGALSVAIGGAAALPRPRRAARLVRLRRDPHRGGRLRLGLLHLPRPHLHGRAAVREPAAVPRPQLHASG